MPIVLGGVVLLVLVYLGLSQKGKWSGALKGEQRRPMSLY